MTRLTARHVRQVMRDAGLPVVVPPKGTPIARRWRYVAMLTLVVACPLAHDRDTCPCNDTSASCPDCREGRACGCSLEVVVEHGPDVPGGWRIAAAPSSCPLNGGRYSEAERAELATRIVAAWENYDFAPWCSSCNAKRSADCVCGPRAEND